MTGKIKEIAMGTDKYYFPIITCSFVILPSRFACLAGKFAQVGIIK
jgi:hypothetical protein